MTSRSPRVALISTYDLGRQPFGLASPAAWLRRAGFEVACLDLAVEPLDELRIRDTDLIAFHLPMHTATRIAAGIAARVRTLAPAARWCGYGLYAPVNEGFLRRIGFDVVLGPEPEAELVALAERIRDGAPLARPAAATANGSGAGGALPHLRFLRPDRGDLPALARYAHLHDRDGSIRVVGYTEASRGCKHRCRHCPIVPVYDGRFRIVQRDVVLEDIRQQVAAGAEHVSFGDPDFFNGIGHAMPLVRALHREFPTLGYDVTIKIEHLLRHREHLPELVATGCRFVTSAVESIDDAVLARLDKGHTRADFVAAVRLCREAGLVLNPTFVAFTPWIGEAGYRELLDLVEALDLVEHTAPIQLALRLLIPAGSRLLDLPEVRSRVGPFDEAALIHPWIHDDPAVDALQRKVLGLVQGAGEAPRTVVFDRLRRAAGGAPAGEVGRSLLATVSRAPARAAVPFLTEPWYC